MLSSVGFIGIVGDSVTIHFLRKKASFHFNNPRNPDAESRSQKVGSLKDFEIRGVPKMELPHNDEIYQPIRHGHLPKVKMKSWHKRPIVYQQQCPIGVCQNPGSDWKSSTNRNSQVVLYRDN
jgi:hypothetical protein